jgi:hypothetical protein
MLGTLRCLVNKTTAYELSQNVAMSQHLGTTQTNKQKLHAQSSENMGMKQCISYLQTSRNLMIQFGGKSSIIVSMNSVSLQKIVRLIKMSLNETYSRVKAGKYLSDTAAIENGLKQETVSHHYFTTLL